MTPKHKVPCPNWCGTNPDDWCDRCNDTAKPECFESHPSEVWHRQMYGIFPDAATSTDSSMLTLEQTHDGRSTKVIYFSEHFDENYEIDLAEIEGYIRDLEFLRAKMLGK